VLKSLNIPTHVRIGTCSWKYDSWQGIVYQDKKYGPFDYLEDYSQLFNTVEIDQWFWSLFPKGVALPDTSTVRRYNDSVPDDFEFSVKAPNSITLTHFYAKQSKGSEGYANKPNPHFLDTDLLSQFLAKLEPMQDKLGPIMFQFEYLNKKKMPSLSVFLERLAEFFDHAPVAYRYAIEIRNNNYLKEEYFHFLKEKNLGCVLLDGYYMPPIGEIVDAFQVHTSNFSVIRLHGPDRSGIEAKTKGSWHQIVEPREERLVSTAKIVRTCMDNNRTAYINVNNHYEGSAPLTIQRLLPLI